MEIENKKYGKIEVKEEDLPEDYKKISLVVKSSKEEIGFVTFKIKKLKNRVAWLQRIEVQKKYQSQGFGDTLITLMEDYLIDNRCLVVEGKFWPLNNHARPFYKKHGYDILREDFETYIYKYGLKKEAEVQQ